LMGCDWATSKADFTPSTAAIGHRHLSNNLLSSF
jgi:hypothetical protein